MMCEGGRASDFDTALSGPWRPAIEAHAEMASVRRSAATPRELATHQVYFHPMAAPMPISTIARMIDSTTVAVPDPGPLIASRSDGVTMLSYGAAAAKPDASGFSSASEERPSFDGIGPSGKSGPA